MWNFAKNRKVKSLDDVPANLRVMYEPDQEGDGYILKSDEVTTASVAVITGMDNALRAVRKEADEAKKGVDLGDLTEYGSTPAEIKAAVDQKLAELAEAGKGAAEAKAQIEKIKREAAEAHNRALQEKDAQMAAMEGQINDYMVETQIQSAAGKYAGLNAKLIMPHVRNQLGVQVEEADGKKVRRVVVKDSDGSPRYSRKSETAGERMSVGELLEEMASDSEYAVFFPSKARTGSQTPAPGPLQPGLPRGVKPENMTSRDKIKAGLEARNTAV